MVYKIYIYILTIISISMFVIVGYKNFTCVNSIYCSNKYKCVCLTGKPSDVIRLMEEKTQA